MSPTVNTVFVATDIGRSCKQLWDCVTEPKNFSPNSHLRAERGCTPAKAHAESYKLYNSLTPFSYGRTFLKSRASTFDSLNMQQKSNRIRFSPLLTSVGAANPLHYISMRDYWTN